MLLAAVDFDNLHQVLRVLYDEMMPLCSNMTGLRLAAFFTDGGLGAGGLRPIVLVLASGQT